VKNQVREMDVSGREPERDLDAAEVGLTTISEEDVADLQRKGEKSSACAAAVGHVAKLGMPPRFP